MLSLVKESSKSLSKV